MKDKIFETCNFRRDQDNHQQCLSMKRTMSNPTRTDPLNRRKIAATNESQAQTICCWTIRQNYHYEDEDYHDHWYNSHSDFIRHHNIRGSKHVHVPLLSLLLISIVVIVVGGAYGIKLRRFDVPVKLKMGANTTLTCHYELEHDRLYAVKWYRDDKEFYRFVPAERADERKQAFAVDGITVDLTRSTDRTVALRDVSPRTAGNFKCEASVEETFQSVAMERKMSVVSNQMGAGPGPAPPRQSVSGSSPVGQSSWPLTITANNQLLAVLCSSMFNIIVIHGHDNNNHLL